MSLLQHDDLLQQTSRPKLWALLWRVARWGAGAAFAGLVIMAAIKALDQTFHHSQFPEALAIKVEDLPWIFPLHMLTGGLALILAPIAIALRHTRWHRTAGRIAAADILIAGLTAIPVAITDPVTIGSTAGFTAQATTWLALLSAGIYNIKRGRIAQHQACMLMMAAVTTGAVFFRLYLAFWSKFGDRASFKTFYAADAWVAWLLPLLLMAIWLHSRQRKGMKLT